MPASNSGCTARACSAGTWMKSGQAAVVGTPATSMLSFTAKGTPHSEPRCSAGSASSCLRGCWCQGEAMAAWEPGRAGPGWAGRAALALTRQRRCGDRPLGGRPVQAGRPAGPPAALVDILLAGLGDEHAAGGGEGGQQLLAERGGRQRAGGVGRPQRRQGQVGGGERHCGWAALVAVGRCLHWCAVLLGAQLIARVAGWCQDSFS